MYFAISMVAGMALTGYCAYLFFWGDLSNNKEVNKAFHDDAERYKLAQGKTPYPSAENLKSVTNDLGEVKALVEEFRKKFSPFPKPPEKDVRGFSSYLEDTILELKEQASNASVGLSADVAFGFTDLRGKLRLQPEYVPLWMQQLSEIKVLCGILYDAKINSVESFRRVPVATNDLFSTPTDTFAANLTNTAMATFTPYKVEFRCFTPELAAVMEGLARSSNCFIVKNVVVKPAEVKPESMYQPVAAPVAAAAPAAPAPPPVAVAGSGALSYRDALRAGAAGGGGRPVAPGATGAGAGPGRPGMAPGPQPVPPPVNRPPPGGATPPAFGGMPPPGTTVLPTVLREKLLYITLSVDAVKLK